MGGVYYKKSVILYVRRRKKIPGDTKETAALLPNKELHQSLVETSSSLASSSLSSFLNGDCLMSPLLHKSL